jgi:hypothetical protein
MILDHPFSPDYAKNMPRIKGLKKAKGKGSRYCLLQKRQDNEQKLLKTKSEKIPIYDSRSVQDKETQAFANSFWVHAFEKLLFPQ